MDRALFQIALHVLQQINKRLPYDPADAETLRKAAPPSHADLPVDQIAVEIIQRILAKRTKK